MSDPTGTTKKLKSRTERELEKLGEGMKPKPKPPAKPAAEPKPKPKPKEKAGVGRDLGTSTTDTLAAQIRRKIDAAEARGDKVKADDLRQRLKQVMTMRAD